MTFDIDNNHLHASGQRRPGDVAPDDRLGRGLQDAQRRSRRAWRQGIGRRGGRETRCTSTPATICSGTRRRERHADRSSRPAHVRRPQSRPDAVGPVARPGRHRQAGGISGVRRTARRRSVRTARCSPPISKITGPSDPGHDVGDVQSRRHTWRRSTRHRCVRDLRTISRSTSRATPSGVDIAVQGPLGRRHALRAGAAAATREIESARERRTAPLRRAIPHQREARSRRCCATASRSRRSASTVSGVAERPSDACR